MTPIVAIILSGVIAYLFGAIPFGYIIAAMRGIDIRTVGSGNIGATNVFRSVGKPWGILTLCLDIFKGFAGAFLIPWALSGWVEAYDPILWRLVSGCCAVVGHNWPVYLRFKGGKGIATSAGALLGMAPLALLMGLGVWIVGFASTRYVSVASMAAALMMAASGWCFYYPDPCLARPIALSALAVVAIWRHQSNIKRLINGTESRMERKDRRAP